MVKSYKIEETKICPRCNRTELDESRNALSRRDNKTRICSSCGEREAFCDYFKYSSIPISEVSIEKDFHKKINKSFTKYRKWHREVDVERCQA